jgi:hypothetical protein
MSCRNERAQAIHLGPITEEWLEEIRAARRMSPEEKLLAGPRMFEAACADIKAVILQHFPRATEDDLDALIRQVVAFAEQRGLL